MKGRMIIGELEEYDTSAPVPQTELSTVAFPMTETYLGEDPDHPDTVELHNEAELEAWARKRYHSYEIFDLTIPSGAILDTEGVHEVRCRELAEVLTSLATAYDDPKDRVREVLEEVRRVIHAAWYDEEVSVDDFDVAHGHLTELLDAAKAHASTPD